MTRATILLALLAAASASHYGNPSAGCESDDGSRVEPWEECGGSSSSDSSLDDPPAVGGPERLGPDEPDRRAGSSIVSEPRSDDATELRAPPLDVSVERRRARRGALEPAWPSARGLGFDEPTEEPAFG